MSKQFDNVIKKFLVNEVDATTNALAKQLASKGATGAEAVANAAKMELTAAGIANPQQAQKDPAQVAMYFTNVLGDYDQSYNWNEFAKEHPEVVETLIKKGAPLKTEQEQKTPQTTPTPNAQQGGSTTTPNSSAPQSAPSSGGTPNIYGTN
jgi:hypothetical protein